MLEQLFQTDAEQIKIRMEWSMDGRTPMYRPLYWRSSDDGAWQATPAHAPMTDAEMRCWLSPLGWRMEEFTVRLSAFEWVHTLVKVKPDSGSFAAWETAKEAIAHGVQSGAFISGEESRKAYFAMRARIQPTEPSQIFKPWLELCRDRVAEWEHYEAREADTKLPRMLTSVNTHTSGQVVQIKA